MALVLELIEGNLVFRVLDLSLDVLVVRFKRVEIVADNHELSLSLVQFQLKGQGVEPKQDLPSRDVLIVFDFDRLTHAGNIGRKPDPVGLNISVVGRHVGAALEVEIAANDQHDRQQQKQRPAQPSPAPGSRRRLGQGRPLGREFPFLSRNGASRGGRLGRIVVPRNRYPVDRHRISYDT